MNKRQSKSDIIFDITNFIIISFTLFIVLYPLYFIVIASISNPAQVSVGKVVLFARDITLEGYKKVFQSNEILIGYFNSLVYTIIGTLINVSLTMMGAYALSRKELPGRNIFMIFLTITMFFSGGLIPTYMVVQKLNLNNTFAIMVLLGAVSVYNVIIARTFIQSNIPEEMREAAFLDGCSYTQYFIYVVLPLSGAITAVLVIYYAVAHWNGYFNALIYLRDRKRFPLQMFLREILLTNTFATDQNGADLMGDPDVAQAYLKAMSMRYSVIIIASLPVMILYPFLQKYFVKGVMIGAIKG